MKVMMWGGEFSWGEGVESCCVGLRLCNDFEELARISPGMAGMDLVVSFPRGKSST